MRRLGGLLAGCALFLPAPAFAAASSAKASSGAGSGSGFEARVEAPDGFSDLAASRDLLVDLYVGGRRIGEARIEVRDGKIHFRDAGSVASLVPNVADPAALTTALANELPANAALICSALNSVGCGTLKPNPVGIIYDEERFRVDLFIASQLLTTVSAVERGYLAEPDAGLSLANSFGFSLSGSDANRSYQLQARNVVGYKNARVRSNAVLASGQGLLVDDLVAEMDRPGWRYSGGLFWAPGSDFTGRRRMLGVGVSTQLDTRLDKEALEGTPLFLFLQQPARVDVLVDGRLVASRFYDAGNNILDTSGLPGGSYPLELRIHVGGSAPRIERRFFVRNAQMAPMGQPLYFAYAGIMADTRKGRPVSLTKSYYARAGTARRISRDLGLEAAVSGTQGKVIAEAGGVFTTRLATIRALGLFSNKGDRGAMAQLTSGDLGPVSFAFDLRRIHSADGGPLLPTSTSVQSFAGESLTPAQAIGGSYTQLTGTIGLHWGSADLQLLGFYRADRGGTGNFIVGPSLNWRLIQLPGMQLTLTADAQKTRSTTAAFLGARMLVSRGGFSVASTAGSTYRSGSDGSRATMIGGVTGQWYHQADEQTELSLLGAVDRTADTTTAQAGAALQTRFGSARADLLHRFGSDVARNEYVVNFQSGGALTAGALKLGGRDLDESAIIASVEGEGGPFELLIDEVAQGRISGNGSLPLFLRPYKTYQVRLRALGDRASEYDSGTRQITLYPGNVVQAVWRAQPVVTVFGRALDTAGEPVREALIEARRSTGQSDGDGWFQVDVASSDKLRFTRGDGTSCTVTLSGLNTNKDYTRVGEVTCR
jgi:hypothetical protein